MNTDSENLLFLILEDWVKMILFHWIRFHDIFGKISWNVLG